MEIAPDVACEKIVLANICYVGEPGSAFGWVLVDTGPFHRARRIVRTSERRFGRDAWPKAIVLTHGHFDHVGAVKELARGWDVPVYAHELELPYLTGRSSYPPADPAAGGGSMAWMSWAYPRRPIDLGRRIRPLPADGSIPEMPGWRWIHTPGHTPGHISLFRDSDRTLIAGDAFTTTKAESMFAELRDRPVEIHGPPSYFTSDWQAAGASVRRLSMLEPSAAITGHGAPMSGDALLDGLRRLARDFDRAAVPREGRYAACPARADATGVVSVPPVRVAPYVPAIAAAGIAAAFLALRRRPRA